jgi:hypothetical protein
MASEEQFRAKITACQATHSANSRKHLVLDHSQIWRPDTCYSKVATFK